MFRGLFLYCAVLIFQYYWCTRKPRPFSTTLCNNSSIAQHHHLLILIMACLSTSTILKCLCLQVPEIFENVHIEDPSTTQAAEAFKICGGLCPYIPQEDFEAEFISGSLPIEQRYNLNNQQPLISPTVDTASVTVDVYVNTTSTTTTTTAVSTDYTDSTSIADVVETAADSTTVDNVDSTDSTSTDSAFVPPNIVYILVDDLGWNDVNFFSQSTSMNWATPAIDEHVRDVDWCLEID